MKKMTDYQKPELREYARFGIIAEGGASPGAERTDVAKCSVPGLDDAE